MSAMKGSPSPIRTEEGQPQGGGLALAASLSLGGPQPQWRLNSGLQNKTCMSCFIHSLHPAHLGLANGDRSSPSSLAVTIHQDPLPGCEPCPSSVHINSLELGLLFPGQKQCTPWL